MQRHTNVMKALTPFIPIALSLLLIGGIAAPPELNAQASGPRQFSLKEAQEFAVQHSYDSRRTQLDIEAAKKKLRETLAIGLPQISSSIGYSNNLELATVLIPNFFEGKFDEKIPVQFGTQHNANVNFVVSQLIFNGSYFVGLQTSKIYRQLADQNHERTQLNVLETVTNTYYLILVSQESLRILNSNLKNLEKTHFEISEMYKEGFVAETDADLVKISITKLKNSLQAIGRQKDVAYNLLKFQMGLDLAEDVALSESLEDILHRIDVQSAAQSRFDLSRNIDFKLLETQERLSEMALKNEKAQYWPTISAFYTFQWNAFRDSFNFFNFDENWFRTQLLGFNINFPIFQSGMQKAKVAQASIALKQAQTAKEQAAQGLKLEAAQAKAELNTAHENYINTKDNLVLSKKVYDRMLVKYKEGVSSSMDLTQANDQFLMAQSDYIRAMSQLLTAKNRMDRLHNNYMSK